MNIVIDTIVPSFGLLLPVRIGIILLLFLVGFFVGSLASLSQFMGPVLDEARYWEWGCRVELGGGGWPPRAAILVTASGGSSVLLSLGSDGLLGSEPFSHYHFFQQSIS